jgi:hypothetical protein
VTGAGPQNTTSAIFDDVEEMTISFQVVHIKRTTNFAAHLCAQHAFSFLAFFFVWAKTLLRFLQPLSAI